MAIGFLLIVELGGFGLISGLLVATAIELLLPGLLNSLIYMFSKIASAQDAVELAKCALGGFMSVMSFYTFATGLRVGGAASIERLFSNLTENGIRAIGVANTFSGFIFKSYKDCYLK